MYTHDNILKVYRNNGEVFFFFFCNVQSHDFEFKEEESNFAKNIGTYLELISEVKNEFLKSEIAKDNG